MTRGHAVSTRPSLLARAWRALGIDADVLIAAGAGAVIAVCGVVAIVEVYAP